MCSIKGSICKLEKLLNIIYAKRKIDLIHAIIPKVKHIFDQHRLCTVTSSVRSEVILFLPSIYKWLRYAFCRTRSNFKGSYVSPFYYLCTFNFTLTFKKILINKQNLHCILALSTLLRNLHFCMF